MKNPLELLEVFPDIKKRSRLKWIYTAEKERVRKIKEKAKKILDQKHPGLWEALKEFQKEDLVISLVVSEQSRLRVLFAHDMGLGKTLISATAAALHSYLYGKNANILVVAPTTSGQYVNFANELRKWGFKVRELEGPIDILKYLKDPLWKKNKTPTFFVIAESKAKLTPGIKIIKTSPAHPCENRLQAELAELREKLGELTRKEELSLKEKAEMQRIRKAMVYLNSRLSTPVCPVCGNRIEKYSGNKPVCKNCLEGLRKHTRGSKLRQSTSYYTLWTAYRKNKKKRWPLHKLIKRYGKGFFSYLIVDEAHEEKKEDSSRGAVVSSLSMLIPNVIYLTGTPFQGKSSQLFFILGRLLRWNMQKFPFRHNELSKFIEKYGVREIKIKEASGDSTYNGWRSKERKYVREAPGIGNKMLWVILNQVMIRRKKSIELKDELTEMEEQSVLVPFSNEHLALYRAALVEAEEFKRRKPPNYSAAYWLLMKTTNLPESTGFAETIPPWGITNKDKTLLNLIRKLVKEEQRKVIVFTGLTDRIPVIEKLYRLLKHAGYRTELWPAGIKNSQKPQIVADFNKNSSHVAVASLGAYNVGLNMVGASAVIFYEPFPRPEFYKQAKDRIWRIGQSRDTRSYLLHIKGSIEEHTWEILTNKIDTMTKFIDGELPPATLIEILEELNKEIIKEAIEKTFQQLAEVKELKTEIVVLDEEEKQKIPEPAPVFVPAEQEPVNYVQLSLF